jgi:hypothetical protein
MQIAILNIFISNAIQLRSTAITATTTTTFTL